ncbi:MAG: hypothetical protein RIS76_3948 [Verrucomicrobiota bacterium]
MAKIFFSLSGEGRGHASRVRAIVESLRHQHEISLFTSGDAFRFLAPLYRGTSVAVNRIAGLRFQYTPGGRLDSMGTAAEGVRYLRRLPQLRRMVERHIQRERPDLAVVDFEPSLPRAARHLGVPFVSVDHQHFLTTYDLRSLPWRLRLRAGMMGLIVNGYFSGQKETVVSSFYSPPLRRGSRDVTQVGVMLRPELLTMPTENRGHLVAYWRRFANGPVLEALAATGREVRIYGVGAQPRRGNLIFREVDELRFLEDLASCDALVSTAGNQLVGEALHLGKPVLVLPEPRNFEQYINAHFLAQSGAGYWVEMERATPAHFTRFLARTDAFRSRIDSQRMNGLPATLEALQRHLPIQAPTPKPALALSAARGRSVSL